LEEIPHITKKKVQKSISELKNNKALGEDGIVIEAIKEGGKELLEIITTLFNKCLIEIKTSAFAIWNNAVITIIHKKGNIADLKKNLSACFYIFTNYSQKS